MKKYLSVPLLPVIAFLLLAFQYPFSLAAQSRDVYITIHLRGVYESKVSLLAMDNAGLFKPVEEIPQVPGGATAQLTVAGRYLPGEFVLRFDYREKSTSAAYPSEKSIILNNQDLELWVNPVCCNNEDSTWFQKGEAEMAAFARFSKENARQKEKLGLLQSFLVNYDDTGSRFYRQGVKEYEQRRRSYNRWLNSREEEDKALFVSSLYGFQYIPEILWKGTETERTEELIRHYFDGVDLTNPAITRTTGIKKWMDNYVNLYGQLSKTVTQRDSLFPLAGKTAIEKARRGDPHVYGWMVDYFYHGYESNNIPAGIKILEPYLDDPACLTSRKMEIERRLKGMESLLPGSTAPDIQMTDLEGNLFELSKWGSGQQYILLFFWSAGCSHCAETTDKLYPWQQQPEIRKKMSVVAISLDETDAEMKAREQKAEVLKGWKHLLAREGIRSKSASDYFILATPVMVLLDAKTRTILAMPDTVEELMNVILK